MSLATDRDYDLGEGYIRRPISVAQLLEREGFRPEARSRATRRALSGVAAGAVLALGAVVGSLLLNHGTQTTTGGTLASGSQSGGDIVLAETSSTPHTAVGSAASTPQTTVPASVTHAKVSSSSHTGTSSHARTSRIGSSLSGTASSTAPSTSTAPATSQTRATTQSAPAATAPSTTTSTPSNSTASTTATTPPATPTTTPPATTATTPPAGGGLLGGVTGVLNGVTQPVFSWFGG